tara:strand:+ start:18049 stop:19509 length:1461 start_codon:yes stop_codon:yes gene_type:complete
MAIIGSARADALPCKIDVIVPVYKEIKYVTRVYNSLPDDSDITVTVVSDMSPYESEHKQLAEECGFTFYALNYDVDAFRRQSAVIHAINNTSGDIVCTFDEDAELANGEDYFSKVKRVLTTYRNLIVFPMRNDRVFETGQMMLKAKEQKCITSTVDLITPQWGGESVSDTFAIRRDFLERIGGHITTDGYGNTHEDMCRRVVRNGGLITLFEDMEYYNNLGAGGKAYRHRETEHGIQPTTGELVPINEDPNTVTIDIVLSLYGDIGYLEKLYNSIPNDNNIKITAVDDMSPNGDEFKAFCQSKGITYHRLEYESDIFRTHIAKKYGYEQTSGDIFITLDMDMVFREPDDFFDKVKKLLTKYSNLMVFATKYDVLYPQMEDTGNIWIESSNTLSTFDEINIQYQATQCDGFIAVRRDLVEKAGGLAGGEGYGDWMRDNVKRISVVGGVVGLFSDLGISNCLSELKREHEEPFVDWDSYKTRNELEVI